MSYTVFALKWRPQSFDDIVGQDHIVKQLANAIQKDRLAHAYLFAGPRGVGKTSTARILARALNCKQGAGANPCGKCPSCLDIIKGSSLDVLEIDGASNRGIDEIRTLRENVKFPPVYGNYKVYIIDEVHQITTDGFNALLKTLEEPPDFVKFIFATTAAHKLPPTILSRCQRLDFRRISVMEIIRQLEKIVQAEKLKVDRAVLVAIAQTADGALRDAESILDQLVAFAKDKVALSDVVSMLGLVEESALFSLTDKIIAKDPKGALELLNEVINEGKDLSTFLNNLLEHFRNLMIARVASADSQLIDLPEDICKRLVQQAQSFSLEEIFKAFEILLASQEMAKRLDSQRIPLEIAIVRLARPLQQQPSPAQSEAPRRPSGQSPAQSEAPRRPSGQSPAQSEALRRPSGQSPAQSEALRRPSVQPPAQSEAPRRPSGQSPQAKNMVAELDPQEDTKANISLDVIKEKWQNLIDTLSRNKISLASYLNEGVPLQVRGRTLTVEFPKNCSLHKESLEAKDNRSLIEKLACDLFAVDLRMNFTLSQQEKVQDTLTQDHPVVQSALDMFNARLVKEL